MTWWKLDDKLFEGDKIRSAGLFGLALWVAAGVKCSSKNTDGVVAPIVAKDAAYVAGLIDPDHPDFPKWQSIAAKLVEVGLWHDSKTIRRCERCMDATENGKAVPAGSFYFHDWNEWQPSKASQASDEAKRKEARKRRLHRDRRLTDRIRDRDGTLCRYCGVRVDFEDRRSDVGGTYDHVDPDGENSFENVVVACRGCNIKKGGRTPEEAGMDMLPPGTARPLRQVEADRETEPDLIGSETDLTRLENGSDPIRNHFYPGSENGAFGLEPDQNQTAEFLIGSDLARVTRATRDGSEPVLAGSETGSENGLDRAGPDYGLGEAGDEAGRAGTGQGPADFPTETEIEVEVEGESA